MSFVTQPAGKKASGGETNPSDAFTSQQLLPSFVQGGCSPLLTPSPLPPLGIALVSREQPAALPWALVGLLQQGHAPCSTVVLQDSPEHLSGS